MSKYTPGPWHITVNAIDEIWIHSEKVSFIAKVSGPNKRFEPNADARLISASPDLADVAHMVLNTATVYTPPELVQAATDALRKAGEIPGEVGG